MSTPRKTFSPDQVVIHRKDRVYDGFFKLDEVTVSHQHFDETMSREKKILVFERGDAVAAMIFNKDRGEVVLVEQFKLPAYDKSRTNGWILETMAGIIRDGETAEEAVAREAIEETGYRIPNPEHIATFFSSPGGSSERIFLYYAVVTDADKFGDGGGDPNEDEDIRVVTMTPKALFERLRLAELEDPKLIIGAYHLRDRLRVEPVKNPILESGTIRYRMRNNPNQILGIKTGNIVGVEDVDVLVNSENTDMMMDRIIGKSISAAIRYMGSEKDAKGNVIQDTVADALKHKLGRRRFVRVGTVLETEPGALSDKGVTRIIHVAAVDGLPGRGIHANREIIGHCVDKALMHVQARNSGFRLFSSRDHSILLPMIGAGDGGNSVEAVAPAIVASAIEFFNAFPNTELSEIYLLAFTANEKAAIERAINLTEACEKGGEVEMAG